MDAATLLYGVAAGVIVLFVEYFFIQKIKWGRNRDPEMKSELTQTSPAPARSIKIDYSLPWPDAINKAVESFNKTHPEKKVELESMNVQGTVASIMVRVTDSFRRESYALDVNKLGEILVIQKVGGYNLPPHLRS